MRIARSWTVSMPAFLEREALHLARQERRSRSELIREALRTYLALRQWEGRQQAILLRARRNVWFEG